MYLSVWRDCSKCGKSFCDIQSIQGPMPTALCVECATTQDDENKEKLEYFKLLDNMSIEERIRKLEIFKYEQSRPITEIPYDPHAIYG